MAVVLKPYIGILTLLFCFNTQAQLNNNDGEDNATAIYKDSSIITSWATNCDIERGYVKIEDTTFEAAFGGIFSNKASHGNSSYAIGAVDNKVVSLGDGGSAVVTFEKIQIENGEGPDFAVFENGFSLGTQSDFLELAFVEVSTDGIRYVRFPAVSNTPSIVQIGNFGTMDGTKVHNLAGSELAGFGTPFDLDDLEDSTGIDVDNINYIKLVDVIGTIDPQYATYDINGNPINDPYPTPYASSGFDLEAVAVINSSMKNPIAIDQYANSSIQTYPNPVSKQDELYIKSLNDISNVILSDVAGNSFELDTSEKHDLERFTPGLYILNITTEKETLTKRIVITP